MPTRMFGAGDLYIERWDQPNETDTGLDRFGARDAQWVVAKYLCSVQKADFDVAKGVPRLRICLFWESGSEHTEFYRLSSAILNELLKREGAMA